MFPFPSSPPFFNKTKVQQPKDTTLYRAPTSYISTDLSTAMKNKVCDVNLLHFLNKWDTSTTPNKRVFNLKKKGLMTLWLKGRLVTRARGRHCWCASFHPAVPCTCQQQTAGSGAPCQLLSCSSGYQASSNTALLSSCPLNYQFVNSACDLRRLHLL